MGSTLESFKIRESPRFDLSCAEKLAQYCPNIRELGLAQIGALDGKVLKPLHIFDQLTYLDISDPGVSAPGVPPKSLQPVDVKALLKEVGANLEYLDISGNTDLDDEAILEGVKENCINLHTLKMAKLAQVTSAGLCELFRKWKNRHGGLRILDVKRVTQLDDEALKFIIEHSGSSLQHLDLNSDEELTTDGMLALINGSKTPALHWLDVSFVRQVTDGVIMSLLDPKDGIRGLDTIRVFGCNRLVSLNLFGWEFRLTNAWPPLRRATLSSPHPRPRSSARRRSFEHSTSVILYRLIAYFLLSSPSTTLYFWPANSLVDHRGGWSTPMGLT